MSDYAFVFESQVAGIPCQIGVTEYYEGSFSYNAASDWDYYGNCDWEVLDRKGYLANWLAKKLTDKDRTRINNEIDEYVRRNKRSRW